MKKPGAANSMKFLLMTLWLDTMYTTLETFGHFRSSATNDGPEKKKKQTKFLKLFGFNNIDLTETTKFF